LGIIGIDNQEDAVVHVPDVIDVCIHRDRGLYDPGDQSLFISDIDGMDNDNAATLSDREVGSILTLALTESTDLSKGFGHGIVIAFSNDKGKARRRHLDEVQADSGFRNATKYAQPILLDEG